MGGSVTLGKKIKLALLNVNGKAENRGTPALEKLAKEKGFDVTIFDVRANKLPNVADYDAFISTGGPGDPMDWGQSTGNPDDNWGKGFFNFLDTFDRHNQQGDGAAKDALFICHSFQLASKHFGLGELTAREDGLLIGVHKQIVSPYAHLAPHISFGEAGSTFDTFEGRKYQVKPVYCTNGAGRFFPLCFDDNGALTGFSNWDGTMVGVQFHPEANVDDTQTILNDTQDVKNREAQKLIIDTHGEQELERMRTRVEYIDTAHEIVSGFLDRILSKQQQKLKIA